VNVSIETDEFFETLYNCLDTSPGGFKKHKAHRYHGKLFHATYTPTSKIVVAAEATVNTPRLQRISVIFLVINLFSCGHCK